MEYDNTRTEQLFEATINTLGDLRDIQCSDGNWNYDPYMQGMANGLIMALSLFDDQPPEFLNAPDCWLKDKPKLNKPIAVKEHITSKELKL